MGDKIISPNFFVYDILLLSPEIEMEDAWSCRGPSDFDTISTEDPNQCYVKVEFAAPNLSLIHI